jgi:hypothetical protein
MFPKELLVNYYVAREYATTVSRLVLLYVSNFVRWFVAFILCHVIHVERYHTTAFSVQKRNCHIQLQTAVNYFYEQVMITTIKNKICA